MQTGTHFTVVTVDYTKLRIVIEGRYLVLTVGFYKSILPEMWACRHYALNELRKLFLYDTTLVNVH